MGDIKIDRGTKSSACVVTDLAGRDADDAVGDEALLSKNRKCKFLGWILVKFNMDFTWHLLN